MIYRFGFKSFLKKKRQFLSLSWSQSKTKTLQMILCQKLVWIQQKCDLPTNVKYNFWPRNLFFYYCFTSYENFRQLLVRVDEGAVRRSATHFSTRVHPETGQFTYLLRESVQIICRHQSAEHPPSLQTTNTCFVPEGCSDAINLTLT